MHSSPVTPPVTRPHQFSTPVFNWNLNNLGMPGLQEHRRSQTLPTNLHVLMCHFYSNVVVPELSLTHVRYGNSCRMRNGEAPRPELPTPHGQKSVCRFTCQRGSSFRGLMMQAVGKQFKTVNEVANVYEPTERRFPSSSL